MAQNLRELTDGVSFLELSYQSPLPESAIAKKTVDRSLRHHLQGVLGDFWAYPHNFKVLELFYFYPHPSSACDVELLSAIRATLWRKPSGIICGLDVRL